ncbi:hypothetical protein A3H10_03555 [Candidatus Uhrbacteria bacterium RIFCSPLOWO2_12_FULL_46_10]|uniref:Uncharacterized protein n=1 Tax=Candidatus Uhrbacteria bacterium RIFCSPLOWO2_01_FULL_47_25 TaxID=1802402 RepID=A0A1F7UWS6_9BACT|nr:MAG: hypothetical protein UX68_C0011G0024 [Parcubacteria group bacterium GW2011_GWA2_46_9]OGL59064.1 MAG: hypothetical protein A2752_02510 [Candidatus Uhrbacteria bacterium RIFCSPHIGHO2_01_FULL_46_23]OGL68731.1 MAG: hypothetical protein A3D60_02115 [Candidatus Uhrbacteria bacterium RIFCSPHIGHO2_02_FULL_47_29]OGL74757.1 MAG: hypothetical protein A3E96_03400 [Candidatus Uhrbacteria bacterium RIFCSPHIGHO2_12_FULL_46_13]OGL82168.1 MAG: hypothetical protein A2936_01230 [Candidatus Uhrbacteria bac
MALTLSFIAVISIFALTGIIWFLNRFFPWRVCAICAGVSGTWLWMIGARILSYNIDLLVPAVLMGGSVVGLAYQLETKLPRHRSPLLWKTLFIPAGFMTVLYLLSWQWVGFFSTLVALAIITGFFFLGSSRLGKGHDDKQVLELEREMDKCC